MNRRPSTSVSQAPSPEANNIGRPIAPLTRAAADTRPGRCRSARSRRASATGVAVDGSEVVKRDPLLVSPLGHARRRHRKRYYGRPGPGTLAARRGSNVPRILIGGYQHEGHSFVPGVLTLDDMTVSGYVVEGPTMLTTAIGDDHEVSGAIDVARAAGVELIPTAHAWGGVGPAIEDAAYRFFEDRILAGLRAHRGRIDGVYLPLHGASITTTSDDPEGDLLTAVRAEVGPDVPVVASFDLHAHTTDRMVAAADALLPYRTCPHTDFRATGQRAMTLLLDAVAGRVRPVTRQRKLRLMASAEKHDTNHGPMVGVMSLARAMETRPGILAVGVTPTQPWLDLSELGWSTIVVADGDADL